ncbi:MAG: zf-HC2 domain-containing protein [Alphaproteobacteria bacterium]|nr:zf-HC2 domain-containing protein [Alphaproteobacteria bacterium]
MSNKDDKTEAEEIDCIEAINGLYQYLDGEMDDAETKQRFEHHLAHCKTCYTRTEMEKLLTQRARDAGNKKASQALRERLQRVLD